MRARALLSFVLGPTLVRSGIAVLSHGRIPVLHLRLVVGRGDRRRPSRPLLAFFHVLLGRASTDERLRVVWRQVVNVSDFCVLSVHDDRLRDFDFLRLSSFQVTPAFLPRGGS
jgi:hypothetical protein